jgi:hypothetical protein
MKYIATGHNSNEPKNDQGKTEDHRSYKCRIEKNNKGSDGQNWIEDQFGDSLHQFMSQVSVVLILAPA